MLKLGGDFFVWSGGRQGTVPGPASRVGAGVGGVCQGLVGDSSLFRRGCLVDNRPHQGMAEEHPQAQRHESVILSGDRGIGRDTELRRGVPCQHRIPGRVRRRDQQEPLGFRGQGLVAAQETSLKFSRQPRHARNGETARQLVRRQPAGQFQQRQRVAARLGDDLVTYLAVHAARPDHRVQQHPRVTVGQAADGQLRQPGEVIAVCPRREHHGYRVCLQAAGGERERLNRCLVKPLGVIDQAQQGLPLPGCRQQAHHGQADEEPVWRVARRQAERGRKGVTLRSRHRLQVVQQRGAQLKERSVREFRLRLHADHPNDLQAGRGADRVFQQSGLADARLASDYQHGAPPAACRLH